MKSDHNYHKALTQVAENVREAVDALCEASVRMVAGQPDVAHVRLKEAETAIHGAMVSAKWATTLKQEIE